MKIPWYLVLGAGFILTIASAWVAHLRIITTDSAAPAGIYQMVSISSISRKTLVLACLPTEVGKLAIERGYLGWGRCPSNAEPVAKIVGALPGDVLDIESNAVTINGVQIPDSPTATRDSMGRRMEHTTWGSRRVAPGTIWLFGFNNPKSWDSRFWGAIPITNVMGELKPVLTW